MRGRLKIGIACPTSIENPLGNSITARRWATLLADLGHSIECDDDDVDVFIALHAGRSHPRIRKFRETYPGRPIVVALTGTDLYRDIRSDPGARESLGWATRIVALQDRAGRELPDEASKKLRVIYQSALSARTKQKPLEDRFEVCVLSHLRDVKDPLRAAIAARGLPPDSRIVITHCGQAMDEVWAEKAAREQQNNSRYDWLGERPHEFSMELLSRSQALVLSSEMEGGANVIAEAVVSGIPVLCTSIPGNVGMLGEDYPAYFELRDTAGLSSLLYRVEIDSPFYEELLQCIDKIKDRFNPKTEKQAWQTLIEEL